VLFRSSAMFRTKRIAPDFRIVERRRQEDARSEMSAHVAAEMNARSIAHWEKKTDQKIQMTQAGDVKFYGISSITGSIVVSVNAEGCTRAVRRQKATVCGQETNLALNQKKIG